MILYKAIILIIFVNLTPLALAYLFPSRFTTPLDFNKRFWDGERILGAHKTIKGLLGAIVAGSLLACLLGLQCLIGILVSLASMVGDLFSSFFKRRFKLPPGSSFPILDHLFEGGFPLLVFHWFYSIAWTHTFLGLLLFIAIAHGGSALAREIHIPRSKESLRLVRSGSRFKIWRSCHVALTPLARYLNFENTLIYRWVLKNFLKLIGVYEKGVKNALEVQLKHVYITCSELPSPFDPFKILFITDLHIDGLDGLVERLVEIVKLQQVDLCLLGGDFRMEMYGPFFQVSRRLKKLTTHIRSTEGILGILGNHDCLEVAPELEDTGICMLINDAEAVERNGERLWIAGIDDPHYYKCHDLDKALQEIPFGEFTILLSHSPEIIKECDGHSIDLCLCGHTHGGQIRFPGLGAPFTHARVPRKYTFGLWKHNDMVGYTSSGAGSSGVPVRFNCPPEVVLITLRKRESTSSFEG